MNIEDVFRKLRPVMGSQLDTLWQEYLVADTPIRQTIERTLRVTLAQRLSETFESEHVLLKPPPQELAAGDYAAGIIHYGRDGFYAFGLREQEFIQHIGIFGRSGSGKTNLAYLLLRGLVGAGKPFLVFDWKRNYRDLTSLPEFRDLLIFTVGRDVAPFRFNPLIPPPGTPATVWLKKLIEVMCHAYYLGEGVTVLLMRAMDALYRQAGLYDGQPKAYPTMANVRDWLLAYKAKGRTAGWMESAMRAVEVLCFGEMGNVLSSPRSFDVARLLDRRVILELDALTNADKTFLIEALLLWIHHYRMAQPQREAFKHAIVIEEAHHILLRKKQEVTGEETVTDVLLREIRELGESVICLDQHPSLISKPALGNTYTTFAFNLKHRGDIAMIQDSLNLDSEQAGYLGRLEVGWAVVRLQGRWFFPFLVKFPLIPFRKGAVSDQDVREKTSGTQDDKGMLLEARNGLSGVISSRGGTSGRGGTQDGRIPAIPEEGKKEKEDKKEGCAIRLTTQERKLLKDVWRYPTSPVTERYVRLDFGSRVGTRVQSSLLARGFLSSSFVVSSSGGRIKVLQLGEKGKKVLGISAAESSRHGGAEHRYWVKRIADRLRASGHEVAEEAPVGGGKTVDLLATKGGRRVGFEIETGKSDALSNVRKCLNAGVDEVIVVALSAALRNALRGRLAPHERTRVLTGGEVLSRFVKAQTSATA